jgi:hypothetical protein
MGARRLASIPHAAYAAFVTLATFAAIAACTTDAMGVDACRQIEEARCQQAPACGIALEPPYHTNGTDVSECMRFYDDACLHGLARGGAPGPVAVSACVAAVRNGNCTVVAHPESDPACAWLVPEAGAAADAADATDAASE